MARIAVVTGGASGIGAAVCRRLARDGAAVAVLDLNRAGAEVTAAGIAASGGRAVAVAADVADADAVRTAIATVRAGLGAPTILANVAGVGEFALLADLTDARWRRMLGVHLDGTFHCVRAVAPDMVAAGWGRIVNVSSVAGLSGGGPGLSHYAAAKGGIIAFSKALAHELGPSGITVNAVAPGLIDTPMVQDAMVSAAIRRQAIEGAPVRRIGVADDVAAAVAYLVSDEASFVTGQVLSPNGGRYM
ncbi:MAG: SDR family NAD(P)-dependent oxidoreductase [Candidatus Binatia bacterium]